MEAPAGASGRPARGRAPARRLDYGEGGGSTQLDFQHLAVREASFQLRVNNGEGSYIGLRTEVGWTHRHAAGEVHVQEAQNVALSGCFEEGAHAGEWDLGDFGCDDFGVGEVRDEVLLYYLGGDEAGGSTEHVCVLIGIARNDAEREEERVDKDVRYGRMVTVVHNNVLCADADFLHALTQQSTKLVRSLHDEMKARTKT